jgi:oxygen-dependent protoporphyrinogen oxidase
VPTSPLSLLASDALSLRGRLRMGMEPFVPRAGAASESVHAFAARRLGREAADTLVDPAVSGISAGDSRELEAAAAFPALVEMEREHGSLLRAMLARRMPPPRLVSLAPGMGAIVDALERRLAGNVRTNARVLRVTRDDGGWRVLLETGERLDADAVVFATSAAQTAAALSTLDAWLAGVLSAFPRAGLAAVALAFREAELPRPLDGYGFLVPRDQGLDTLGVVWESSAFAHRAPAGHVLLRIMLGGARRPRVAELPAPELLVRVRAELATTMGITAEPVRHWLWHWPHAITQYTKGHLERVARARARLALHPGLELCGTSYDGISFTAAIASAERTAARLLASPARDASTGATRAGGASSRPFAPSLAILRSDRCVDTSS